jgi:uncharacterized membrane protein
MIPIHPRIVHFPVALLITAAAFGILALIFKSKRSMFREVLIWDLTLGVAGTLVAIISGLIEEKTLAHNDAIHSIMEAHKLLGFIFSGIFLVLWLWMIVRKSKMKTYEFTGVVVILIITAGLLAYSAHLGGKMVYQEGAGVAPMEAIISHEEHQHIHIGDEKDMHPEHAPVDTIKALPDYSEPSSTEAEDSGHKHEHDHDSHDH